MPSEGKPLPIDEATIERPADVPAQDLWPITDRMTRHRDRLRGAGAAVGDALAALALGVAARRVLDDQEPELVRGALRLGATWAQIAQAVDVEPPALRAAFLDWAEQLPDSEQQEARLLAAKGDR